MKKLIKFTLFWSIALCTGVLQASHAKTLLKRLSLIATQTRSNSSFELEELINLVYGSNDARVKSTIENVRDIIDLSPQPPLQTPFVMNIKTLKIISNQLEEWQRLQKKYLPGSKTDRELAQLILQYTERINPESYFVLKVQPTENSN